MVKKSKTTKIKKDSAVPQLTEHNELRNVSVTRKTWWLSHSLLQELVETHLGLGIGPKGGHLVLSANEDGEVLDISYVLDVDVVLL